MTAEDDALFADRARDAVALIRCWFAADEEGAEVILAALAADGDPAATAAVARILAWLAADALAELGVKPEFLAAYAAGRRGLPPITG
jgi:hypothetical protein